MNNLRAIGFGVGKREEKIGFSEKKDCVCLATFSRFMIDSEKKVLEEKVSQRASWEEE